MTTSTDELTQPGVEAFGYEPGGSGDLARWWWVPLVAVAAVALLIGGLIGYQAAPSGSGAATADVRRPGNRSTIIEPGALLGGIDGANRYRGDDDVDRYSYAWPGQELTAPEPSTGEAVAWQWQLCDVPPAPSDDEEADADSEPAALECAAVEGATDERWASPPTNRTRLVRVLVTIDLGDDVLVRAASRPIAAVDWPDDVTPGDPPPEATPPTPPARS
jgi:hypothetical protein